MDDHEGPVPAGELVEPLGRSLLPRARLADEDHRVAGLGGFGHPSQDRTKCSTAAEK